MFFKLVNFFFLFNIISGQDVFYKESQPTSLTRKYLDSFPLKVNWYLANKICRILGYNLVSIETDLKQKEIDFFLKQRNPTQGHQIWTSGTSEGMNNFFFWITTGNSVIYTHWDLHQPSRQFRGKYEDCIELRKGRNKNADTFLWNDANCLQKNEFVCEVERKTILTTDKTSKYFFSFPAQANWPTAINFCNNIGQRLISINTNEKQIEIENLVKDFNLDSVAPYEHQIWTSGTDIFEGTFEWITTGELFNFTNWKSNEPNGGIRENCVGLWTINDNYEYKLKWNDAPCSNEFYFICEKYNFFDIR